jgi:hypothetical protein
MTTFLLQYLHSTEHVRDDVIGAVLVGEPCVTDPDSAQPRGTSAGDVRGDLRRFAVQAAVQHSPVSCSVTTRSALAVQNVHRPERVRHDMIRSGPATRPGRSTPHDRSQ